MRTRVVVGIIAAIAWPAHPASAHQAAGSVAEGTAADQDSTDRRRRLERAQVEFERVRREHMRWGYPSYGSCDYRIGRFCLPYLRYGDEGWVPPVEAAAVADARDGLVARLDSAAWTYPGDDWIAGQRVRYLTEGKRYAEAVFAGADCRAARWWCNALLGYAHFAAGDYVAAETAFDDALDSMEPDRRCDWTDLSSLLMGDIGGAYRRLDCAERDTLQRRLMRFADPLFSVPGNELRAEHFSRHVHSLLLKDAESPEGDRWGGDLHEFILRYGPTFGWERIRRTNTSYAVTEIVGHFGHGARYFFPDLATLRNPTALPPGHWDITPVGPRSAHIPRYATEAFDSLPHQLAVFRRADTLVAVAGYDLGPTPTRDPVPHHAYLAFVTRAGRVVGGEAAEDVAPTGIVTARVPAGDYLVSLEVVAPDAKRAGRARRGLSRSLPRRALVRRGDTDAGATRRIREISDLLLTYASDSLAETLETAIAMARPTNVVVPGERIGLYWELYGVGPSPEALATSLQVVAPRTGFFKRALSSIGLRSDDPPVSLEWRDVTLPPRDWFARSIALDLPPNLSRGIHIIRLRVTLADGRRVTLQHPIDVRVPPQP